MHRPRPRLLTVALLVAATSAAACSYDEAALVRPDAVQVHAEPGQLRVLSYDDHPSDEWIDVVRPDPAVFVEGDGFREDDSRTAEPDEPAERRRLFTAVDVGRTLLVELNCKGCDDGVPTTSVRDTGLHVWELVVGDPGRRFSTGTGIADADTAQRLAPGDHVVVVRPGAEGPAVPELASAAPVVPLRLVATHTPDHGADLFVDVYAAVGAGDVAVSYRADVVSSTYRFSVR